ncbi:MAG: hypothetical protein [Caudoviricetes sp.]|nr:MAG: hypothetical protein [Caudoviricetes sp.]
MTDKLEEILSTWLTEGLNDNSPVGDSSKYINQVYLAFPELVKRAVTVSDVVLDKTADWDTLTVNKLFAFNGVPDNQKLTITSTQGYLLTIRLSANSFGYQVVFGDGGNLAYRCTTDSKWYANTNDVQIAALQETVAAIKQNVDSAGLAALNKRITALESNQDNVKQQYTDLIKQIQIGGTNLWSDVNKIAGYLTSSGDVIVSATGNTRVMQAYIPINGYTNVVIRVGTVLPTGGVGSIAFYDKDKRYLSTPEHPQGSAKNYFASIAVPARAQYMRLCFPWVEDRAILVQFGTLATGWIPSMDDIPFSSVGGTISGMQNDIAANKDAFNNLQTKVQANTTDLVDAKAAIQTLQKQFEFLPTTQDLTLPDVDSCKDQLKLVYNQGNINIVLTAPFKSKGSYSTTLTLKPYTALLVACDGVYYYVLQLSDNLV